MFGFGIEGKLEDEFMDKSRTIRDMREFMCMLDSTQNMIQGMLGMSSDTEWCDDWTYLEWSSWFMMITGFIGIIALAIGAGLQHYYWNIAAFEEQRQWAKGMFVLGPGTLLAGIATYTFINS